MSVSASQLPVRLCIGWGLGTFAVAVMFNSIVILMQRFATDFLGVAAATWGAIFLISKIYDAVTDPVMGVISDRTRSPLGRRRPYLLVGAIISVFAFYCLFHAPSVEQSSATVILLFGCLLLYSTGYTIFNVPYIAMLAEMTEDPHQRARLVSYRVYAVGLGTIVGLALGPYLVNALGGDQEAHQQMALMYSVIALFAFVACFYLTKDAQQSDSSEEAHLGLRESLAAVWMNKAFMRVAALKIAQLTGVAVSQILLVYMIIHVLGKDLSFMGIYGLIAAISTMLGPVLCIFLMKQFDKRHLYLVMAVAHALIMLTWLLSGPEEATVIIILRGSLLGVTAGAMIMIGQTMLPDAINYETYRTGLHREGIYSGIYTTAEKMAFALGGALTGFILGGAGYISSTTGTVTQPDSAVWAIYFCAGVLPAIFALISCLFLKGYDLSEQKTRADARGISTAHRMNNISIKLGVTK